MKHPPVQYPDEIAKEMVNRFIRGEASDQADAMIGKMQSVTAR
jgi:hypothetical protein